MHKGCSNASLVNEEKQAGVAVFVSMSTVRNPCVLSASFDALVIETLVKKSERRSSVIKRHMSNQIRPRRAHGNGSVNADWNICNHVCKNTVSR